MLLMHVGGVGLSWLLRPTFSATVVEKLEVELISQGFMWASPALQGEQSAANPMTISHKGPF